MALPGGRSLYIFRYPPSSVTSSAKSLDQANFPHLRIIQLGSDVVTPENVEAYQKHFSADTGLIIRFGTTETGTLRRMFLNVEPRFEETTMPVGYATEDTVSFLCKMRKITKCHSIPLEKMWSRAATSLPDIGGDRSDPRKISL